MLHFRIIIPRGPIKRDRFDVAPSNPIDLSLVIASQKGFGTKQLQ